MGPIRSNAKQIALRPGALAFDESARCLLHLLAKLSGVEHARELVAQVRGIACPKQRSRLPVTDELQMPAHIRCHQELAHRHGFERFQGRHHVG